MLKIQEVTEVYNKINSKSDDELAEIRNTQEKVKKEPYIQLPPK